MRAEEIAQKIHKQLSIKINSREDEDNCLILMAELEKFCKTATDEDMIVLRKECPFGEAFVRMAKGIEWDRKRAENEVTNDRQDIQ